MKEVKKDTFLKKIKEVWCDMRKKFRRENNKKAKKFFNKFKFGIKRFCNMSFGKIKGVHILFTFALLLVIGIVLLVSVSRLNEKNYPVLYINNDGELMASLYNSKPNKTVKLSNESTIYDVLFGSVKDNYVLFIKDNSLYFYDTNNGDKTIKIIDDIAKYDFTPNNKNVIALDNKGNLYSSNLKKDALKLDNNVKNLLDYNNSNVVYIKNNNLYLKKIDSKKDNQIKIAENVLVANLSVDNNYVWYLDKDNKLNKYNVSKKKNVNIAENVFTYVCDEDCNELVYLQANEDKAYSLYFTSDKKVINDNVSSIRYYDIDNKDAIYLESDMAMYYQSLSKNKVKIDDKSSSTSVIKKFDKNSFYYVNNDKELYYIVIKNNKKVKKEKLSENVNGDLFIYKDGCAFIKDLDEENNGSLWVAKKGKAKKVADNIYNDSITISTDGKRVYYIKDFDSTRGLYYLTNMKSKLVDSGVYKYQYVNDDLIYYLKDYNSVNKKGDLYRFNGKKIKIEGAVKSIAELPIKYKK